MRKPFKLECQKCGHTWFPRTDDVRQCPKCKTLRFDKKGVKQNATQTAT